ncbi:MAG: hypothetical protein M0Z65_02090 [Firmicutes bacterium]|uniref:Uncharacterized protein n=1 Tax=Melghirimyces thermohalophilus TaxID=1236220 RepID=A0A1G6JGN9_9BACL|nr:hypothetical protein [Melghirimyces thermohalophilus]MDA8351983.1 hypothetical protein [Bacillota bacterium]SDC17833.1 hypothetical protein SAMN04488112_10432 [Melghirimyces thermohalophilus]
MRKLDIQIEVAREQDGMDKESFHRDLRQVLEKYFVLKSLHIRKEVHTVEVDRIIVKPEEEETEIEWQDVLDIEREPLVTELDSTGKNPQQPTSVRPSRKKRS